MIRECPSEPIFRRQRRIASFALRNAFLCKKLLEELFRWLTLVAFHTFKSTLYALDCFYPILRFQELLIALSVLHDEFSFTVNCQYNRLSGLLELAHDLRGVAFEGTKALNIARKFHLGLRC